MNHSLIPNEIQDLLLGPTTKIVCHDIDCRRDGECVKTKSWESSFQRAIMNATIIDDEKMKNICGNDIINCSSITTVTNTVPTALESHVKTIIPPLLQAPEQQQQQQQQQQQELSDESNKSKIMKNIGRPCSDCGKICVALVRVVSKTDTRLVCSKCRRRY
jgi:hypothetical protein